MPKTAETITNTIISALPGWELIVVTDAATLSSTPIIAWDIQRSEENDRATRFVTPITASWPDVEGIADDWAIKRPDGKFEVHGDEFEDEHHLILYFKGKGAVAGA